MKPHITITINKSDIEAISDYVDELESLNEALLAELDYLASDSVLVRQGPFDYGHNAFDNFCVTCGLHNFKCRCGYES